MSIVIRRFPRHVSPMCTFLGHTTYSAFEDSTAGCYKFYYIKPVFPREVPDRQQMSFDISKVTDFIIICSMSIVIRWFPRHISPKFFWRPHGLMDHIIFLSIGLI